MRWQEFDNPEEEQKRLEEVIRKDPNNACAHYELGEVCAYEFDFDRAIALCKKAIAIDPDNITFRAFLSYVYTRAGDNQQAIEELATVIELGGDESDYDVDVAQAEQSGMASDLAQQKITALRNEGKTRVADKLQQWLLKR